MGSFSIWHWLIVLLVFVLPIFPLWRIFKRTGRSGAWSLLLFVPFAYIPLFFFLAYARWPAFEDPRVYDRRP